MVMVSSITCLKKKKTQNCFLHIIGIEETTITMDCFSQEALRGGFYYNPFEGIACYALCT